MEVTILSGLEGLENNDQMEYHCGRPVPMPLTYWLDVTVNTKRGVYVTKMMAISCKCSISMMDGWMDGGRMNLCASSVVVCCLLTHTSFAFIFLSLYVYILA
jgi:hypothetical protein